MTYLPRHFDVSADADAWLPRLIARDPFVTLLSAGADGLAVSHLPVLAERDTGGRWQLVGHMARANPHWQGMEARATIAIVHGPHAYVSPRWYPQPALSVPTWNYAVAHVHGSVELVTEAEPLLAIVDRLSAYFEGGAQQPWSRADGDPSLAKMAAAIVGFRLHVERVEVKAKLGQQHPVPKVQGAIDGLSAEPDPLSREVAALMREALAARTAAGG